MIYCGDSGGAEIRAKASQKPTERPNMEMNFVVKTCSERLDGAFMLIASGICNAK